MITDFEYRGSPARIVFGPGSSARVAEMVEALGCTSALVLVTARQADRGRELADALGSLAAGVFAEATMHTPVDVTERALAQMARTGADCTVALGGGSTTGLGKAIAYRLDTPQVVIPTTYAGSEVTPVLGQTDAGMKTTVKAPSILPEVVLYDPDLTRALPWATTVTSALNAMAHAAEGLYARDRNPISSLMAVEGVSALLRAMPVIADAPDDARARSDALYGAWLCGTVLGTVGMALHHKLCHTLGGMFDLPHAATHAIMLPHTVAYTEVAEADTLRPLARALGASRAGVGFHAFARKIGAPTALRDLGLEESALDHAADQAIRDPYWNPRPVTRDGVRALLQSAWTGAPPTE